MTTLDHTLPRTGVQRTARARGALAVLTENAYLRLFTVLIVIAAGAALFAVGITFLLDAVLPLIFNDELRALASIFPQL